MSVRKEEILSSIKEAQSFHVLKFLGEVLSVHKAHQMEHTKDEEWMESCREHYAIRFKQLQGEEDAVRQREERGVIQERESNGGEPPAPVPGKRDRERSRVQRLLLDKDLEEGDEVHESEA